VIGAVQRIVSAEAPQLTVVAAHDARAYNRPYGSFFTVTVIFISSSWKVQMIL
jgi:hypothetical protein